MAVYEAVAKKVCELGRASALDLGRHLPHLSMVQINHSLKNARRAGLIDLIEQTARGPGVYGPSEPKDDDGWTPGMPFYAIPNWARPPASVWELGTRAADEHHRRAA